MPTEPPPIEKPETALSSAKTRRSRTQSRPLQILSSTVTKQVRGVIAPPNEAARRDLIALTAYYIAQKRGFAPGHEEEDWICAEAQVRRLGEPEG